MQVSTDQNEEDVTSQKVHFQDECINIWIGYIIYIIFAQASFIMVDIHFYYFFMFFFFFPKILSQQVKNTKTSINKSRYKWHGFIFTGRSDMEYFHFIICILCMYWLNLFFSLMFCGEFYMKCTLAYHLYKVLLL